MYSIIWSPINNKEYKLLLTNNNQTILYPNSMNANINSNEINQFITWCEYFDYPPIKSKCNQFEEKNTIT